MVKKAPDWMGQRWIAFTPICPPRRQTSRVLSRLDQNLGVAFMGDTKGGAFDVEGRMAREWLSEPLNANGRPNSDVLKPWVNGLDLTRRPRDMWIIDFGWTMGEGEAALYERPFTDVLEKVKPGRDGHRLALSATIGGGT